MQKENAIMGLFGGNRSEPQNYNDTSTSIPLKFNISQTANDLKTRIENTSKSYINTFAKTEDKISLSALAVIVQQNEVIIKYLDYIAKKLDNT